MDNRRRRSLRLRSRNTLRALHPAFGGIDWDGPREAKYAT